MFRDNLYSAVSVKTGLTIDLAKRSVDAAIDVLKAKMPANTGSIIDAILDSDNGTLPQQTLMALGFQIVQNNLVLNQAAPAAAQAVAAVDGVAKAAAAVAQVAADLSQPAPTPAPVALAPAAAAPAPVPAPAPITPAPAAPAPAAAPVVAQVQQAAADVKTSLTLWQRFLDYWKR